MSSGSYFPSAVRRVEIPKKSGGKRPLGIPTATDRTTQTAAKMVLEPLLEPHFHKVLNFHFQSGLKQLPCPFVSNALNRSLLQFLPQLS